MTIVEWLRRLNLDHYAPHFIDKKVFFVSDMRLICDAGTVGSLFKVDKPMDVQRIVKMGHREALMMRDFSFLTTNSAR